MDLATRRRVDANHVLRTQALKFMDAADALDSWRQQSTSLPLRPDREPNRPLTSLHVMIEEDT